MATTNIIEVKFGKGDTAYAKPVWQYSYGQILKFVDLDLPQAYKVHFSNYDQIGVSVSRIGGDDGVHIPNSLFLCGKEIYAWVFLHAGEDDGETVYKTVIPIQKRAAPCGDIPTPEEEDEINDAIIELNKAVEQTAQDVEDAAASATLSRSYAVGDTDSRQGEETDNSKYYKEQAELAQQASEEAQAASEEAQRKAELAQGYAEEAQRKAESAQGYAEEAQRKAEEAERGAELSEQGAYISAERAEQAAKDAGYMFFYIDSHGDLIYQRTSNVQVDFYLHEGNLYVKVVG